jgi:hypothetical protein
MRGSHLRIVLNELWLDLSPRSVAALGEGQKPERARRHARGGGGFGGDERRITWRSCD